MAAVEDGGADWCLGVVDGEWWVCVRRWRTEVMAWTPTRRCLFVGSTPPLRADGILPRPLWASCRRAPACRAPRGGPRPPRPAAAALTLLLAGTPLRGKRAGARGDQPPACRCMEEDGGDTAHVLTHRQRDPPSAPLPACALHPWTEAARRAWCRCGGNGARTGKGTSPRPPLDVPPVIVPWIVVVCAARVYSRTGACAGQPPPKGQTPHRPGLHHC